MYFIVVRSKPTQFSGFNLSLDQIFGFNWVGLELMQQQGQLLKVPLVALGTSTNGQKDTSLQKC